MLVTSNKDGGKLLKIGKKISFAILGVVFILILSTAVTVDKNIEETLDERFVKIRTLDEMRVNIGMQGLYARSLFIANTKENQDLFLEYSTELQEKVKVMNELGLTPDAQEQIDIISSEQTELRQSYMKLVEDLDNNNIASATNRLVNEMKVSNLAISEAANKVLDIQDKALKDIDQTTDASVQNSLIISIILVVISVVIGSLIIFIVKKSITKPLANVMENAKIIADGDLTAPDLHINSKDELGELSHIFNDMKSNIKVLISNIKENSEQLNTSSQELTASTEEITASTEEVTTQLTTAADMASATSNASADSAQAMDETAKGVHRIAEASQVLQQTSQETSKTASNGKDIITSAQSQMVVINDSTQLVNDLVIKLAKQTSEIEGISKVIADITDQTNLLALNASIEAARAGEHGKGFAVVADEVKKLANESKESANLINQLTVDIQADTKEVQQAVNNAIGSVKDGVAIITTAGEAFEHIVTDVHLMTEQIEEVSATAEQLSASAEEVSASIAEIANQSTIASEGLSTIAAAMEEQTATMNDVNDVAINLSSNTNDLNEAVQKFKA